MAHFHVFLYIFKEKYASYKAYQISNLAKLVRYVNKY